MRSILPKPLRDELARQKLKLPTEFPFDLRVRLARSKEDFDEVFSLLEGKLTKYHALPSTSTLVITSDEQIIGTVGLIRSNSFGTPVDAHPDVAFLKESGARLVTITSFAMIPEFEPRALLPFFKGIFDYCVTSFGCEVLSVLAPNKKDLEFYESVLLFERLASHAVGCVAILKMNKFRELYTRAYEKRIPQQNLARFLEMETKNVELPSRAFNKLSDPVLTPALMRDLFTERTDVFANLSDFEKQVLFDLYDTDAYRAVLPPVHQEARELVRRDKRFEVDLPSRVIVPQKGQVNGSLRNVSAKGLLFDSERALREGERYTFQLPLSDSRVATIEGVILRNEVKRRYAIRIVNASSEWLELIGFLERDLRPQVHS